MVLTPTCYVLKMFKEHQENNLLGLSVTAETNNVDSKKHPDDESNLKLLQFIESASVDALWYNVRKMSI